MIFKREPECLIVSGGKPLAYKGEKVANGVGGEGRGGGKSVADSQLSRLISKRPGVATGPCPSFNVQPNTNSAIPLFLVNENQASIPPVISDHQTSSHLYQSIPRSSMSLCEHAVLGNSVCEKTSSLDHISFNPRLVRISPTYRTEVGTVRTVLGWSQLFHNIT